MGIKNKKINGVKISDGRMQSVEIDVRANCSKQGEQLSFQVEGEESVIRVLVKDIEELIAAARKGKK